MKKNFWVCLALILCLALSAIAMADCNPPFTGKAGNAPTFETLEEAHMNACAAVGQYPTNETKTFVAHPALDGYPEGKAFVYRSANQYAGRAAGRLNTNLIVYTGQSFESKDDAYAFLESAGLIEIIDEAIGSIVLVTPINGTFGAADAAKYYALQTAMLSQKAYTRTEDGKFAYYADGEYFGGFAYEYFIGLDDGATFFNNYISTEIDFAGRIAGALLIGGEMYETRKPAIYVPVVLVNAKDDVIAKYREVNGTNATAVRGSVTTAYNQAWPLRKVVSENKDEINLADVIKTAYYDELIKAMRVPVRQQGVYTVGTPYSGYNFDQAPYSLCDRNAIVNGKTADGIVFIKHQGDTTFSEVKTLEPANNPEAVCDPGQYINVWYEYIPEEVLDGTAAPGSIPLILALHGNMDDARGVVDEFGLLELAGRERIALVSPDHQLIGEIRGPAFEALINYMLEKYPALDASRVYSTGYSMGGGATYIVGHYNPSLFAAVAPFAANPLYFSEEEIANFDDVDLPVLFSISSYDGTRRLTDFEGHINEDEQAMVRNWAANNGITLGEYDFDKYPYFGQPADLVVTETVNDEFERITYTINNDADVPMVSFTYVKGLVHALYPEYAQMAWDFMKHYSRDLETGAVIYNAAIN